MTSSVVSGTSPAYGPLVSGFDSLVVVFFSTRGGKRGLVTSAVAVLALSVTACSSDEPSLEDAKSDDPSAAARAKDEKAAVDTYRKFWDIQIKAQNAGKIKADAFNGVADGPFVEAFTKVVRDSGKAGFVRVGEPELDGFEPTVNGDEATVTVCVNEDDWDGELDGKKQAVPNEGPQPQGAGLERRDEQWIVTSVIKSGDVNRECA